MAGTLYLVATPIGNLQDITIRAISTLFSVSTILCEDTRLTGNLLSYLVNSYPALALGDRKPTLISFNEHNEDRDTPQFIAQLEMGRSLALTSDAGTPLLSDPGYPLVRECLKRNIRVVPIPGASSLLAALVGSGLPPYPFLFLGFPPEKKTKRIQFLEGAKLFHPEGESEATPFLHVTVVMFASPHKVVEILEDFIAVFGDVPIVVARELTKVHEEFLRDRTTIILEKFQEKQPKGELVIVFTRP